MDYFEHMHEKCMEAEQYQNNFPVGTAKFIIKEYRARVYNKLPSEYKELVRFGPFYSKSFKDSSGKSTTSFHVECIILVDVEYFADPENKLKTYAARDKAMNAVTKILLPPEFKTFIKEFIKKNDPKVQVKFWDVYDEGGITITNTMSDSEVDETRRKQVSPKLMDKLVSSAKAVQAMYRSQVYNKLSADYKVFVKFNSISKPSLEDGVYIEILETDPWDYENNMELDRNLSPEEADRELEKRTNAFIRATQPPEFLTAARNQVKASIKNAKLGWYGDEQMVLILEIPTH